LETTLTPLGALAPQLRAGQAARADRGLAAEEYDAIVRAHQRRIYRVLLGLVRDPDAAATLTQECFLRAYRHRRSFRGEASVGTWLVRIAVNLAADHSRNRRTAFWRRLFAAAKPEGAIAAVPTADELPTRGLRLNASSQSASSFRPSGRLWRGSRRSSAPPSSSGLPRR